MGILTRAEILAAQERGLPRESVEVSEFGGTILVQEMDGTARDWFENSQTKLVGSGRNRQAIPDLSSFRARLAVASCINEDGTKLFTEEDVGWLSKMSGAGLTKIAEVATRLSQLTQEDVDTLLGNSNADQNGDSGSNSHLHSDTDPSESANGTSVPANSQSG